MGIDKQRNQFKLDRAKQSGLSLIELMIALVIGLLLTAAVVQMFVASKTTYAMQTSLAQMQENARFAMEFIARDLRTAGYMGCSKYTSLSNTLNDENGDVLSDYDLGVPLVMVDNYDASVAVDIPLPSSVSPLEGSDIINVKTASTDDSCMIESHNASAASIHCQDNHNYESGQILLVSDCAHSAIFQQSNTNNNGTISVIDHNTGNGSPGNCSKGLGFPTDCTTTNGNAYTFPSGAFIQAFESYSYYLAMNDFGDFSQPALYRASLSYSSGTSTLRGQELVEGVEDMQITYGLDLDDDGDADTYRTGSGLDMSQVVAIRVSLLIRSISNNLTSSPQTYTYNGATVTATDNRLRKVFTSTITLRNRVI